MDHRYTDELTRGTTSTTELHELRAWTEAGTLRSCDERTPATELREELIDLRGDGLGHLER